MIKVHIKNETQFRFKYKRCYKKIVENIVNILHIKGNTEINVIILNNKEIRSISKEYRNKDKATDILSFPTEYKTLVPLIGYNMLGDIYLSYEKIEEQSIQFGHSKKREWTYLFTHGVLHLLGYDHKTKKEEKEMNKLAYKIMDLIKVDRNE